MAAARAIVATILAAATRERSSSAASAARLGALAALTATADGLDDGQSLRELGRIEAGCLELLRVDARWKIIVLNAGGQNLELVSDEVLNIRWVDVVVTWVLAVLSISLASVLLLVVMTVLTIVIIVCGRRMILLLQRVML